MPKWNLYHSKNVPKQNFWENEYLSHKKTVPKRNTPCINFAHNKPMALSEAYICEDKYADCMMHRYFWRKLMRRRRHIGRCFACSTLSSLQIVFQTLNSRYNLYDTSYRLFPIAIFNDNYRNLHKSFIENLTLMWMKRFVRQLKSEPVATSLILLKKRQLLADSTVIAGHW